MRFLADMGVSPRVVDWLRSKGHEAIHLREEGLQRLPDDEIFEKAILESRILLTFDLDFAEITALSGRRDVCVVIFRLANTRTDHVIQRLATALAGSSEALNQGAVVTIEDSRYRIRELPIRSS